MSNRYGVKTGRKNINRFFKKSLKYLRRRAINYIKWNYQYAVREIYRHQDKGMEEGVILTEVIGNYETTLTLPNELARSLSSHYLFDDLIGNEKNIMQIAKSYYIGEIEKGRIYSDNIKSVAVFTKNSKFVSEVSYLYRSYNNQEIHDTDFFNRKFFIEPQYYSGTILSLLSGGGGVWNYFHWLIDTLARIELVRRAGLMDTINWLLVPAYDIDFQIDSLMHLGFDRRNIIVAREDIHVTADKIISTTNPRSDRSMITPRWVVDYLRCVFEDFRIINESSPKKVYISRSDSKRRIITNETEVFGFLKKHGFQSVILSALSLKEKIELFANADVIIGGSGAGLTNLLFCKPGTKVLEIFTEGFVDMVYYGLAKTVLLKYNYMICKHDSPADNLAKAEYEDTYINMDDFEVIFNKINGRK